MPRTANTRLRSLLEEAEWGSAQLARAIGRVAAEHGVNSGCDPSTVSRWLAGTRPRPPNSTFLLEALSRQLHRPVTAREAGLSAAPGLVLGPSWDADPVTRLAQLTKAEAGSTGRHGAHGTMVFSLTALAVPALTLPHAPHRPPAPGLRRVGASEADQMSTLARAFADVTQTHGAGHLRAALTAYLAHDVTGWLRAPATEAVHQRLLRCAAQLSLLLGTSCTHEGDEALAQHYFHTAAQLADAAEDGAMSAIALRTMATHAYGLGHHGREVLYLAEYAARRAQQAPTAVQAYSQAQLAVVQAHHEPHAALAALGHAERLHSRVDTQPGLFTAYPLSSLLYQRGMALTTLGDLTGAVAALRESLRSRAPTERHAAALTHTQVAETLLNLGHLDEALGHWRAFLDAYPDLHSTRARARLLSMRQRLRPHARHGEAADLLDQAAAALTS